MHYQVPASVDLGLGHGGCQTEALVADKRHPLVLEEVEGSCVNKSGIYRQYDAVGIGKLIHRLGVRSLHGHRLLDHNIEADLHAPHG